jgi:protein-serine/threonine kinase
MTSQFSVNGKRATDSYERRNSRRKAAKKSSPEDILGTIEEVDLSAASILTVENVSAAKIYLETYFNELMSRPTPRSLRRRMLEADLFYSPSMPLYEKDQRRRAFYQQEKWHLRESRVLKCRSSKAAKGHGNGPYIDGYEVVKILGKGSFGVVRLVREKQSLAGNCPPQVYAMKVIRKTDMLRSSQEGHLRAERDFLIASEGSNW